MPQFAAIGLVVSACLILLAIDAANLWHQRGEAIREARQDAANLARSLGQQAEDTIRFGDISIVGSVSRLEMDGSAPETVDKLRQIMLARLHDFPALASYTITDADGKCLATSMPSVPSLCSLAGHADFNYHRTNPNRDLHLNPPVKVMGTSGWVIPVSRRFNHRDGSFGGIVEIGVSTDYFQRFYDTFDIGPNGAVLLATADGVLLVRRPFSEKNIGRDLRRFGIFREELTRSPTGIAEIRSSTDGVLRVNAYRTLEPYPLVISVALATEDALARWRADALPHLLRTIGLVAVIAALGVWLAMQLETRRRLSESYQETAAAFRLLAENSTDMIARLGPDMERLYLSPACRELLGYEPEELLGRRADDIVDPADHAHWEEVLAPSNSTDCGDVALTFRARRKDARVIWLEVHRRRLASGEGFVTATRDVTRRVEAEERLATANRQLEIVAMQDGLTGLANRRHFDAVLDAELRRARRDATPLSLIMIDVDFFKRFNDRYGHVAGDACLQQIASAIKNVPGRPGDLVARYGGEEFAIILPNTAPAGALPVAERVRLAVRSSEIVHEENTDGIATISLGVATIAPERALRTAEELIKAADEALYRAKEGGRDQVRASAMEAVTEARSAGPPIAADD